MQNPLSLADQLLRECKAMAHYAFTSGIKIPNSVIEMLNLCEISTPNKTPELNPTANETGAQSASALPQRQSVSLKQVALLHVALARIISPATPRTILLMFEQNRKKNLWTSLGSVPLVGKFMLVAILFLGAWIAISLSPDIDGTLEWSNEHGLKLLLEELFVLFAAGIGACFSILFQINRFVVRGTYDPKYDSIYWTRLVLGIVAGMILALMIPLDTSSSLKTLTKPTLAILGGFSVTVVYRILMRLVNAVESLVRGDTEEIIESQAKVIQAESDASQTENRIKISTNLMNLRGQLDTGQNKEDLKNTIDQILNELMPQTELGADQKQNS